MSDIIPPILSSTPPPLADIADDEDDFGDFAVADDPFQTDSEPGKDVPWNEDCLKKSTDNTSQDSVLSGNTDSGLCSDSSPLPGLDNNCDHQPANCDVPSSESIIKAQCDSPKTCTKSETNFIPLEKSVNCENGDSDVRLRGSQTFNGNVETSSEPFSNQPTLQTHNEEQSDKTDSPKDNGNIDSSLKQFDLTGCLQNLKEDFIKTEDNSNFELNWNGINEQSLNDVNKNLSKEFSVGDVSNEAGEVEERETADQVLNFDFGDLVASSELTCEGISVENSSLQTNIIPADIEYKTVDPVVDDNDQNDPTPEEVVMTVQNICDDRPIPETTTVCEEEPPIIPQDLEFDFPIKEEDASESFGFAEVSSKDNKTTNSFGFLDESPTSQNPDKQAFNQIEEDNNIAAKESENEEVVDVEDFGGFAEAAEFSAFDSSSAAEFGAFESSTGENDNWALPETETVEADDDFGDFEEAGDDFGQFEESAQDTASLSLEESDSKQDDLLNQPEKIRGAVESIFCCDSPLGPPKALTALSSHLKHLWPEIQDVQNTPALEFQWNNSRSHDHLLSALGIDTRNILYGHQWNSSMPRFAANLGHSPLEPLKAADVAPNLNPLVTEQEGVPAAQFDWNGSGLVNPLDSNLLLNIDLLWDPPGEPTAVRKVLSAAVQKVLSSLPDLSYMRAASLTTPQV